MNISKFVVLKTIGCDIVYIHTDKPSPMLKVTDQNLLLRFDVEANDGESYIRKVFGNEVEIETISTRG
jgi:hypothetical protein